MEKNPASHHQNHKPIIPLAMSMTNNSTNAEDTNTSQNALILFRGTEWHHGLSPEEIQQTMSRWNAWVDGLAKSGKLLNGHPLANEGKIVAGKNAQVSDGPFAESKEAIGGYLLLQVGSLDEAVKIAQNCPALSYGITVEVRPVIPMCPAEKVSRSLQD